MNRIVPPLRFGDHGENVTNLQTGLLLLVNAEHIPANVDER